MTLSFLEAAVKIYEEHKMYELASLLAKDIAQIKWITSFSADSPDVRNYLTNLDLETIKNIVLTTEDPETKPIIKSYYHSLQKTAFA